MRGSRTPSRRINPPANVHAHDHEFRLRQSSSNPELDEDLVFYFDCEYRETKGHTDYARDEVYEETLWSCDQHRTKRVAPSYLWRLNDGEPVEGHPINLNSLSEPLLSRLERIETAILSDNAQLVCEQWPHTPNDSARFAYEYDGLLLVYEG